MFVCKTFFLFVDVLWHGNFMCYRVFKISTPQRVWTQVLMVPSYPLVHSAVKSTSVYEHIYSEWNIKSINHKFLEQNDSTLTQTFLFGGPASSIETNTLISRQQFNMFYLLNDLRKLSCTQNHVNHFQRF